MNSPLPVALTALALSAVAIGFAVLQSPAGEDSGEPQPSADIEAVLVKLEQLEESDRDLRAELEQLRMAQAMAPARTPTGPAGSHPLSKDELEGLVAEVGAVLAKSSGDLALRTGAPPAATDFTAQVEASLDQIQVEQARDKASASLEKRTSSLSEDLAEASAKLGLSSSQEAELESAILTLFQQQSSYGVMLAEGVPHEEIGAAKGADHASFQESLGSILSPDQLEEYGQLNGWVFPGGSYPDK